MTKPKPKPNRTRYALRVALLLILLLAIAAFFLSGLPQRLNLDTLKSSKRALDLWQAAHPWRLAFGYLAVYIGVVALSLPGATLMTLGAGAIFGLWEGSLIVSFASAAGATLAMLATRFIFRDAVRHRFVHRLRRIDEGIARDGAFYLFSLRLVPVFPFFIINLLMGLTAIPTFTYYWVTQIAMFPGTLVYVNAGTQFANLKSLSGLVSPVMIGSLAMFALLPWLSRWATTAIRHWRLYRRWPRPKRYDRNLVVIGAGAAGLVSAYIAATVRAKVTLVEGGEMGGDCLNTGCVPSKALIRIARAAHEARHAGRFGIGVSAPTVDFAAVMRNVRQAITQVAPHDSVSRYTQLGVDVRRGKARIVTPWCVEVDGAPITTRAIVIAAGSEPLVPALPGLHDCGYLTSDTLWNLQILPQRLLILGGGPIGCEMAQAFARLGSRVTLVEASDRLLVREDDEVSAFVRERLESEGVRVLTAHVALSARCEEQGKTLRCEHAGIEADIAFDEMLIAIGRVARTRGYGLEELEIPLTRKHTIETDKYLQTLYPNIYACGDVAGPYQQTHAGAHQAWFATINALFGSLKRFRPDYRVMPAVTFTDPEIARVGLNEREASLQNIDYEVTRYELADLDRAVAEREPRGFVKLLTSPGKDKLLGATCVGAHAGEWMPEFALAMHNRIGLGQVLRTVHAYPTFAEAGKYAAGAWQKAHAPQRALRWLARWQRWRRG
ncbi:MAG TPA: FAD-dependent oxidoreductase [Rhodanobacteraceae bacterium]|nr:FAD-dependent oxidoreductase [Rhodanobacteraceae bacterium]